MMMFYIEDYVKGFLTFQRGYHAVEVGMLYITKCKHSYDKILQFDECIEFYFNHHIVISVVTTDAPDNFDF